MNDELKKIYKNSFPETLKNASDAPHHLYIRGQLASSPDQKYLCVIGSRLWSPYGKQCVNKILSGIRGYPISIVSGLAIGIDSIAHEVALDCGLHCVAFPGSTLAWDGIYPQEHTALAKRIVQKGGALLSRWRVGYMMGKWAFPARNKLMAAISHAVLIIEANEKSGSLLTAQHALDYGRDVFAIPGPISARNSSGGHLLIKDGAKLIRSADDLLEELDFVPASVDIFASHAYKSLPAIGKQIVELASLGGMTSDMVLERLKIPVSLLNQHLSRLELAGLIRVGADGITLA
jgi:DNA processing protein